MKLVNETWNQHFLSQAEQRLNAIDTSVKKRNMRIHSFRVHDRDKCSVTIDSPHGAKIYRTLALDNLFTFRNVDAKLQENFESLFERYERDIQKHTLSLLEKIDDEDSCIKLEILEIFVLKLLNTFRNPYCIRKTLNTFSMLGGVRPLDPMLAEVHARVQRSEVSSPVDYLDRLDVTKTEYEAWIDCLFLLLMRENEDPNFLELTVKGLFEDPVLMRNIGLYVYSDEGGRVLVSDRSFVQMSEDDFHLAYAFNLTSHAFIFYSFVDIETQTWEAVSIDVLAAFEKASYPIRVQIERDNLSILEKYNGLCVYQCSSQVFCSSMSPYGINVINSF